MEDLTIKVAEYEGPMDVLLHLIREMKIDIYDIPMNELTKQYLNFIHSFQNQNWKSWMKTGSQSWKILVIS